MLLKSGIIVAFFTLLSRFFGLARELFIAATFGSSAVADCVNVAFKFPNLFRRIFGEGALSAVFIPIFNEKLLKSTEDARNFSTQVFSLLLIVLVSITIVVQILMPYLMIIIAPGFYGDDSKYELAVVLCRITTPYLIFVCIGALFGGMLNSIRKFAAFAFVPVLMNILVIAVTLALKPTMKEEYGIALSLIVAGILQVAFMYYNLWKNNLTCSLLFNVNQYISKKEEDLSEERQQEKKDVQKLIKNMGPAAISSGAQQLNLFISQSIASFLPGAVSILSYADRLYQFPLALIGISFGTVLLPELSKLYKQQDFKKANILQNTSIQIGMLISIPACIGLISLSEPIIHNIYKRGEFSANDTIDVANALSAFALGLPAYVLAKILIPIFYANGDTKTPLKITLYSMLLNTLLNIMLMMPFGHVGIAAGSSIAAWVNVYLLSKYSIKYGDFSITTYTKRFAVKTLLCALVMSSYIYMCGFYLEEYYYSDKSLYKLAALFSVITSAALVYFAVIFLFKMHKHLLMLYRRK